MNDIMPRVNASLIIFPDLSKIISGERTVLHLIPVMLMESDKYILAVDEKRGPLSYVCRIVEKSLVHLWDDVTEATAARVGAASPEAYFARWDAIHEPPEFKSAQNPIICKYVLKYTGHQYQHMSASEAEIVECTNAVALREMELANDEEFLAKLKLYVSKPTASDTGSDPAVALEVEGNRDNDTAVAVIPTPDE